MISKTDISITLFHKNYFDLNPEEKKTVDNTYDSHQELRTTASKLFGDRKDARTEG